MHTLQPGNYGLYAAVFICMGLFQLATFCLLVVFIWQTYSLGKRFERFVSDTETQIHGFLATHRTWSDVADKAIDLGPKLFESGSRFLVGLQQLQMSIHAAGGLRRILGNDKPQEPKT